MNLNLIINCILLNTLNGANLNYPSFEFTSYICLDAYTGFTDPNVGCNPRPTLPINILNYPDAIDVDDLYDLNSANNLLPFRDLYIYLITLSLYLIF